MLHLLLSGITMAWKRFDSISKGDLMKYVGMEARFESNGIFNKGIVISGLINFDDKCVYIGMHRIYDINDELSDIDNEMYERIEINIDEKKDKVSQKVTYEKVFQGSDGSEFTETAIDGEDVEDLKEQMNSIKKKLAQHKKLFSK